MCVRVCVCVYVLGCFYGRWTEKVEEHKTARSSWLLYGMDGDGNKMPMTLGTLFLMALKNAL